MRGALEAWTFVARLMAVALVLGVAVAGPPLAAVALGAPDAVAYVLTVAGPLTVFTLAAWKPMPRLMARLC